MPTATAAKPVAPKPVPVPDGDFYQLIELLTPEEKAVVKKVRTYMEANVKPIINKYWSDDAFPFELLPSFKALGISGLGFEGYGCPGGSQLRRVGHDDTEVGGGHAAGGAGNRVAEDRRPRQTLTLLAFFLVPLTLGVWIRTAVPNFLAADISFETIILLGLFLGPGWATVGGLVLALPAAHHGEYLALPFDAEGLRRFVAIDHAVAHVGADHAVGDGAQGHPAQRLLGGQRLLVAVA